MQLMFLGYLSQKKKKKSEHLSQETCQHLFIPQNRDNWMVREDFYLHVFTGTLTSLSTESDACPHHSCLHCAVSEVALLPPSVLKSLNLHIYTYKYPDRG